MRIAYEDACTQLHVSAGQPLAAALAAKIISLASDGERDPEKLKLQALASINLTKTSPKTGKISPQRK
jgi:hypothetical protein